MANDINRKNLEKKFIADISNLTEGEALSFEFQKDEQKLRGFLIMQNANVHAYVNRCPHTGVNLEWQPNQFLDRTGQFIQCATHGARFNIQDGLCIYGPCQGRSLIPIPIEIFESKIFLRDIN